jgi:tetratricopeptide (TPR) repeat protein
VRLLLSVASVLCLSAVAVAQITQADILEKRGWDALAERRAHDAADAFRQAIAIDPKNARLFLGAGMAAALERRDADAKRALDRALTLDPNLALARALLGQLIYRGGDLLGAIHTYEALLARTPDDKEAIATLEKWRRELDLNNRMQESIGTHFTVSFEGPDEAALAARALESLDRAYWRIGGMLTIYPNAPIAVVLYTNEQFRDITRSPSWAVGAYDGTIRVPMRGALDEGDELHRVLAHEYTHAVIRGLAPRGVPQWLNEGLASALESDDLSWAEKAIREASGPLEIPQVPFSRLTGRDAQFAYAASALAARRMIDDAGGVAILNLLRDLGAGVSFETAFERRMQRSFADFLASLRVVPD